MYKLFFFAVVASTCLIRGLNAATYRDQNDEWVKKKEQEANQAALDAYDPDPIDAMENFNRNVRKILEGANSTRRNLGRLYKGPCLATNPIDRCWRCRTKWAKDRKKLATCVKGFGRRTTGGLAGEIYVVVDPSDDDIEDPKPGTLRHAVIQKEPLWIIFDHSMIIKLREELIVQSDKTIDGRGATVHIAHGAGITIQFVQNVIIHGISVHDSVPRNGGLIRDSIDHIGFRTPSDGDGITIFGSTNVWIDHVTLKSCYDGLLDAVAGSTAITISNCHFSRHNESLLFGAHDATSHDAIMQITLAFNHFGKGLVQRMPRCRWGFFHVVNNDYTHWQKYAIGGSAHPTIISQGNRFIAPPQHEFKEVTHRDYASEDEWMTWNWRSEGDLMLNGAFFRESGVPVRKKKFGRLDLIKAKGGTFVRRLTRFAGALKCKIGSKC